MENTCNCDREALTLEIPGASGSDPSHSEPLFSKNSIIRAMGSGMAWAWYVMPNMPKNHGKLIFLVLITVSSLIRRVEILTNEISAFFAVHMASQLQN